MTISKGSLGRQPAYFQGLVERVEEAAHDKIYAERKEMWTRHHRLEHVAKAPVYVGLYIIPGDYSVVWQQLIPPDTLVSQDTIERDIELQLRKRLYKHDHIPDDDVLLPTVWIRPVRSRAPVGGVDTAQRVPHVTPPSYDAEHGEGADAARLWGMPFELNRPDDPGGAYKVAPVLTSEADLAHLHHPAYDVDLEETRLLVERVTELVDGRLAVKTVSDEVGFQTSETLVSLMGIEAVLYGVIDRPGFIHQMMEYITEGTIAYHQAREAAGGVEAESSWFYRARYEELPPEVNPHQLRNSWVTLSAQSLCGLSPAMYAEFLQPYHARLVEVLGFDRVYYHACEDITKKIPIIRELPNLRRIQISPWTDLEVAVEQLGRTLVLETEAHTGDTVFVHTPDQMREAVERILAIAGDCLIDVQLISIQTVGSNPGVLTTWAQVAQEVTARHT